MKKICTVFLALSLLAALFPFALNVSAAPLNIVTVGDSITWGSCSGSTIGDFSTVGNRNTNYTYQGYLSTLFGSNCTIRNFGASGLSVLPDPHYLSEGKTDLGFGANNNSSVQRALNSSPDVVLIMLGTNDSKITQSGKLGVWDSLTGGAENFHREYRNLVTRFRDLPCAPKVYVMTPPPALPENFRLNTESRKRDNYRITNSIQDEHIVPIIYDVAEELGVGVIDVRGAFPAPLNGFYQRQLAAYLMDAVHPNYLGYKLIADTVAETLKNDFGLQPPSSTPPASTPPSQNNTPSAPTPPTTVQPEPLPEEAPKTYEFSLNLNGGSCENLPSIASYPAGSSVTIPSLDSLSKDGYQFLGWSISENATEAEYQSGEAFSIPEHNVTLFAVWSEIQTEEIDPPTDLPAEKPDDSAEAEPPSESQPETKPDSTSPELPPEPSKSDVNSTASGEEYTPSPLNVWLILGATSIVLLIGGIVFLILFLKRKKRQK